MTTNTRIYFEQPPARMHRPKKTKHEIIADKLTKRPGEWALIGTYKTASSANSIGYMIRTAKAAAYSPASSFQAVSRGADGKHGVWARYVGTGGEHA